MKGDEITDSCLSVSEYIPGYQVLVGLHVLNILIAVPGNAITCFTIYKSPKLHKQATYLLISSVSIADLLIALLNEPLQIIVVIMVCNIKDESELLKSFWSKACSMSGFTGYLFATASVLSVAGVTMDRFVYIVFPYKYERFFTKKRAYVYLAITWVTSFAFGLGTSYFLDVMMLSKCFFGLVMSSTIVSFSANLYFYKMTLIKTQQMPTMNSAVMTGMKHQRQLSFTILLIAIAFGVLWLPHAFIELFIRVLGPPYKPAFQAGYWWTLCISSLNSSVNVLIYAKKNITLRNEILKVFRCCSSQTVPNNAFSFVDEIQISKPPPSQF